MGGAGQAHDVVVVGSGAAGGWAAKELCEAGLRVLVLEAGPAHPVELLRSDARAPEAVARRPVQSRSLFFAESDPRLYVDDLDNPYEHPPERPYLWIRSRQVGGRTLLWRRVVLRMSDHELKAASRDGHGADWPLCHADLAPAYERVERFLGVMGRAEGLPQLPDGSFLPPAPLTEGEDRFRAAVLRRWPERRTTPLRLVTRRGPEDRPAAPGAFPHFTSPGSTLEAAARTGRLVLRPDAVVTQLVLDERSRRVRAVAFRDATSREAHEVPARAALLCASSIESVRILLCSGIGNASGLLGTHLMDHLFQVGVIGIAADLPAGPGPGQDGGLYVPRFRNLGQREPGFLRGYGVQCAVQRGGLLPVERFPQAQFHLWAFGEVLARPENRVSLDPERRDAWGVPAARIDCRYSGNEIAMAQDAVACMTEMAEQAGFRVLHRFTEPAPPGSSIHELGGARMGASPERSVVDPHGRLWDVPNLFVSDGSVFPSAGHQNPTLTIMALTVRACARLVEDLRSGAL